MHNAGLSLNDVVDAAVERGVIDAAQRDQLRALAAELATASPRGAEAGRGMSKAAEPAREARRGFNAVTVAYSLGALLVLVALGWFLFDRWESLGPGGVLVVAAVYAGAFAGTGALLRRRAFVVAGGLAT